jgi:UDP-N-acetylglucosamine 4,6-dehydratase
MSCKEKKYLITGGTGSFGQTMVRHLLGLEDTKEVRVLSRDEKKQEDMRRNLNDARLKFFIGDVRCKESARAAVKGVGYIFHAAALKQVPSCEFFPMEAVKTNIHGTDNLSSLAIEEGVTRFVMLSTDKAVYPINVMGVTKACAERVILSKARNMVHGQHQTIFSITRYGNVMASRGSVIPLFVRQLKEARRVTITDPNMTRFLMSLEESVDLVLHAFQESDGGEIFVRKAPAATVSTLAQAIAEILEVSDYEIDYIGARHGEKLYEALLSKEERATSFDEGSYYKIKSDLRDLNYDQCYSQGFTKSLDFEEYTSHNTQRFDVNQTIGLLGSFSSVRSVFNA